MNLNLKAFAPLLAAAAIGLSAPANAAPAATLNGVTLTPDTNATIGWADPLDLHIFDPNDCRKNSAGSCIGYTPGDDLLYVPVLRNDSLPGDPAAYTWQVSADGIFAKWDPITRGILLDGVNARDWANNTPRVRTYDIGYRACLPGTSDCTNWVTATVTITDNGVVTGAPTSQNPRASTPRLVCADGTTDCQQTLISNVMRRKPVDITFDLGRSSGAPAGSRITVRPEETAISDETIFPGQPAGSTLRFDPTRGLLKVHLAAGWAPLDASTGRPAEWDGSCWTGSDFEFRVLPDWAVNTPGGAYLYTQPYLGTGRGDYCNGEPVEPPKAPGPNAVNDAKTGYAATAISVPVTANDKFVGTPRVRILSAPKGISAKVSDRNVVVTIPKRLAGTTQTLTYRLTDRNGADDARIRVTTPAVATTGAEHVLGSPADGQRSWTLMAGGATALAAGGLVLARRKQAS